MKYMYICMYSRHVVYNFFFKLSSCLDNFMNGSLACIIHTPFNFEYKLEWFYSWDASRVRL